MGRRFSGIADEIKRHRTSSKVGEEMVGCKKESGTDLRPSQVCERVVYENYASSFDC